MTDEAGRGVAPGSRDHLARLFNPHAFDSSYWANHQSKIDAQAEAYRQADVLLGSDWYRAHVAMLRLAYITEHATKPLSEDYQPERPPSC